MWRCTQLVDHRGVNTRALSWSMVIWKARIVFWKISGYHVWEDKRSLIFRNKAKEMSGNLIVGVRTEMSLLENNK